MKKFIKNIIFLISFCTFQALYGLEIENSSHRSQEFNDPIWLAEKAKGYMTTNLDSATYYANLLLALSTKTGNENGIGNAYHRFGMINFKKEDYLSALKNHHKAYGYRKQFQDELEQAKSLYNIARSHYYLYSYTKAIEYYKKSLHLSKQYNINWLNKLTLQNLAFSYRDFEKLDSASIVYNKYIDSYIKNETKERKFKAFNDLGNLYLEKKDYALAESNFLRAQAITREINDEERLGWTYINLALTYEGWDRQDDALTQCQLAIDQTNCCGLKEDLYYPYMTLGKIYEKKNEVQDAARYLALAADHANMSNGNYKDLQDIYHAQAEVFDRLGRQDQALTARRKEENIKAMLADQNSNQEAQRKAAEDLERRLAEEGQTATTPIWFMALLGGGALIALLGMGYMARKLQPAYVTATKGQQTTSEEGAWSKKDYKIAYAQLTREKNQLNFQVSTLTSEKAQVLQQKQEIEEKLDATTKVKTRLEREKEAIQADHEQMKAEFAKMKATLQAAGSSKATAQQMIDTIEEKMAKIIHDLKSPISSSQRLSEMIRKKIKTALEEDKRLAMSMKMLDESLEKAITLVETNLLALASNHTEKKTEVAFYTPFDFIKLIEEVVEQNRVLASTKNIQIFLEKHTPALKLATNRQSVDRATSNVLGNAIKFSEAGSAIKVWTEQTETHVSIAVKDEGPGMSEEDLTKLPELD